MALTIVTPPATEPLKIEEVRTHLRLEETEGEIITLEGLIKTARDYAEAETGRALITQTWDWTLDAFPAGDLEVPLPNLQSVTSIKYINTSGTLTTWLPVTQYSVDIKSAPGRISPAYGVTWPSIRPINNAVTVQFVAGYGLAAAVPEGIKLAMLEIIGFLYMNRGTSTDDLPPYIKALLWPYGRVTF